MCTSAAGCAACFEENTQRHCMSQGTLIVTHCQWRSLNMYRWTFSNSFSRGLGMARNGEWWLHALSHSDVFQISGHHVRTSAMGLSSRESFGFASRTWIYGDTSRYLLSPNEGRGCVRTNFVKHPLSDKKQCGGSLDAWNWTSAIGLKVIGDERNMRTCLNLCVPHGGKLDESVLCSVCIRSS
jgi:hypothetical protein